MEEAFKEIAKYGGVLGPLFILAVLAIVYLFKELRKTEKEKFDLALDVKDNVTLTIKSINDTMKAILIAVERENDEHKRYDRQNTENVTLKN